MDMGKSYHDSNDNECNILQMVHREPEWAANRIQKGEKAIDELTAAQDRVRLLEALVSDAYREGYSAGSWAEEGGNINPVADWEDSDTKKALEESK